MIAVSLGLLLGIVVGTLLPGPCRSSMRRIFQSRLWPVWMPFSAALEPDWKEI